MPRPPHFVELRFGPNRFFTHRGVFFHQGPHGFVVVNPPVGLIVPTLPIGFSRVYVNNVLHFRFNNIYYRPVHGGFMVVDRPPMIVNAPPPVIINTPPPVIVNAPPPVIMNAPPPPTAAAAPGEGDFQTIWIDGAPFFFRDGQFFQQTDDGLVWVEPFAGAVVQTLPADATSVWIQETEYFESDGAYYRRTPGGFEVVAAPLQEAQN